MNRAMVISLLILLGLGFDSAAFACHPDQHFGILVSLDSAKKTFTLLHLGEDPKMGGKLFTFSAEKGVLKDLRPGRKIGVQFVTERQELIAKKVFLG